MALKESTKLLKEYEKFMEKKKPAKKRKKKKPGKQKAYVWMGWWFIMSSPISSVEEYNAAKDSLKNKKSYSDLTPHEIEILKLKAKDFNLVGDVIDVIDRLALIECLFYHCENRDGWYEKCQQLEDEIRALKTKWSTEQSDMALTT